MIKITKEFVDELYDPSASGLKILDSKIEPEKIKNMNDFIKTQKHTFEVKREKYIQNNQLVSLLYRGPFDFSDLEKTIFVDILDTYKEVRKQIESYSEFPFEQGTSLEVKLIHYPVSELGVGNHKDLPSNINIVVFFNLEGSTNVMTYSDKQNNNPVAHPITQGDISIMRAPRFLNETDIRPYHAVEKVSEPRTVLVIREINEELEKITNKDNWRGF